MGSKILIKSENHTRSTSIAPFHGLCEKRLAVTKYDYRLHSNRPSVLLSDHQCALFFRPLGSKYRFMRLSRSSPCRLRTQRMCRPWIPSSRRQDGLLISSPRYKYHTKYGICYWDVVLPILPSEKEWNASEFLSILLSNNNRVNISFLLSHRCARCVESF